MLNNAVCKLNSRQVLVNEWAGGAGPGSPGEEALGVRLCALPWGGSTFLGLHLGGGSQFVSFLPEVLGGCFAEFGGGAGGWRESGGFVLAG